MTRRIYLVGSLRNDMVPITAGILRQEGHDVFDDWFSAGPEADDYWQAYEKQRERSYSDALAAPHAQDVFQFDKRHLDRCDTGVLVMPAGKSGHLELGYLIGRGFDGYVLFDKEPERYDVMYNFCRGVFFKLTDLCKALKEPPTKIVERPYGHDPIIHPIRDAKPAPKLVRVGGDAVGIVQDDGSIHRAANPIHAVTTAPSFDVVTDPLEAPIPGAGWTEKTGGTVEPETDHMMPWRGPQGHVEPSPFGSRTPTGIPDPVFDEIAREEAEPDNTPVSESFDDGMPL